jgi:hypothetical protein
VIALQTVGEHQKMVADRIGGAPLRGVETERELGTVDRLDAHIHQLCDLGEAGRSVETVVVGECPRGEPQTLGLGEQVFR